MAIDLVSPQSSVDQAIAEAIKRQRRVVFETLSYVGMTAVAHARSLPSPNAKDFEGKKIPPHQPNYIDWTNNLRSSIGYVIIENGRVASISDFEVVGNGADGAREGRAYAESLVNTFAEGLSLVVVAGMEYASYVANDGYDVLDSAELVAEKLAKELMNRIFDN